MQTTFVQLLMQHAKARPDAPAMREKEYGIWQTLSWSQLAVMVERHRDRTQRLDGRHGRAARRRPTPGRFAPG